jgi:hypothetical protein
MSKEEKTFVISGEATFEAQDIDDALKKLSRHFQKIRADLNSDLFKSPTSLSIKSASDKKSDSQGYTFYITIHAGDNLYYYNAGISFDMLGERGKFVFVPDNEVKQ